MHTLMPLPFAYDALEPVIDAKTVEIHYSKHHQTYVNKLNELLATAPAEFQDMDLVTLLHNEAQLPENLRVPIHNNAGQVYNHNVYWESMKGGEQTFEMGKELGTAIDKFETYEKFQKLWTDLGMGQFGSGWVWLCLDHNNDLIMKKTANADIPWDVKAHLMVMDVWEHAYYLNYQNRRADYIANFFKIVNWKMIDQKFLAAVK
jgi:Fe-Mn family superoxide dismutase